MNQRMPWLPTSKQQQARPFSKTAKASTCSRSARGHAGDSDLQGPHMSNAAQSQSRSRVQSLNELLPSRGYKGYSLSGLDSTWERLHAQARQKTG